MNKSSLIFSDVIAGCMKWGQWGAKFNDAAYRTMIEDCVAKGITSFDHADIYGGYTTEAEFGIALQQIPGIRKQMQLISKCGIKMISPNRSSHHIKSYDTSYQYIISCAEISLKNLHTDFLDLFLIHRPDPLMNPSEIAEAFSRLIKDGKILSAGVSNFTVSQVEMLQAIYPVAVNQIEISITALEPFLNGQLDQCQRLKMIPMAWSPLGGGNMFTNPGDRETRILQAANGIANKYETSSQNILLAFLHMHPAGIIPVLGTSKTDRLFTAYDTAHIKLEREEWFMLWEASTGQPVP